MQIWFLLHGTTRSSRSVRVRIHAQALAELGGANSDPLALQIIRSSYNRRPSVWKQRQKNGRQRTRCSLDSHCVTNHTPAVREGDITHSSCKVPVTLRHQEKGNNNERALGEQFNVTLGTVPRHSIHSQTTYSPVLRSGLSHRINKTLRRGLQILASGVKEQGGKSKEQGARSKGSKE